MAKLTINPFARDLITHAKNLTTAQQKEAQIARGADLESGNIIQKAKAMIPILVPLFVSAFRRANDLAMAMEARCYRGGEGRTKMKPLVYKKNDYIAYAISIVYVVVAVVIGKL